MIYETLLDNEVNERYVNQILDDVEKNLRGSASMDIILSNVYQKMVLKFGQPQRLNWYRDSLKSYFLLDQPVLARQQPLQKWLPDLKWIMAKK